MMWTVVSCDDVDGGALKLEAGGCAEIPVDEGGAVLSVAVDAAGGGSMQGGQSKVDEVGAGAASGIDEGSGGGGSSDVGQDV